MKAARGPRANELDEFDEDTRFLFFFFWEEISLWQKHEASLGDFVYPVPGIYAGYKIYRL